MALKTAPNPTKDRPDRTFRIITMGLLCLGTFFLVLAVQSTYDLLQLHLFGVETNGTVIRQEVAEESVERYDDGREYTEDIESYYAIVSFRTSQGAFTIRSYASGTNAPLYPTESRVRVVYPPRRPEKSAHSTGDQRI